MKYRTHTTWTEARSRQEVVEQLTRWGNDDPRCIGAYDFPVAPSVGSAEATVRFDLRGQPVVVSCRSQPSFRQNLRCVAFAVESMRMNEKRGIADTLAKAYVMIEAPREQRDPYEVLGVRPDADPADIEAVYRSKARRMHPEAGGSEEAMKELNNAFAEIRNRAS